MNLYLWSDFGILLDKLMQLSRLSCVCVRQNVLDQKIYLGQMSAILCGAWSKEPKTTLHIALCMLSIHSPE